MLVAGLLRIPHLEAEAFAFQNAGVAHLAPGFRVEGRAVQQHHRLAAGLQGGEPAPLEIVQPDHLGLGGAGFVAEELHFGIRGDLLGQGEAEPAGSPPPILLLAHGRLEAIHVGGKAPFSGDIGAEVRREAVGVVQLEDQIAGQRLALQIGDGFFQHLHALLEGFRKALLLPGQHGLHMGLALDQLRVGIAHLCGQNFRQAMEERPGDAQLVPVAQGAADDAAQNIGAILVAGGDAIGHQEDAGAQVVGDHPQGGIGQRLPPDANAGELGGPLHQAAEQVDLEIAMHPLQNRGHAFQAHAGIHAGPGQGF